MPAQDYWTAVSELVWGEGVRKDTCRNETERFVNDFDSVDDTIASVEQVTESDGLAMSSVGQR